MSILRAFAAGAAAFALAFGSTAPAQAAVMVNSAGVTITTNTSGQIVTASDGLFSTSFTKGTCDLLFSNCSAFAFATESAALAAANWLLDKVFLGVFDTNPKLVNGCTSGSECDILIPYGMGSSPSGVFVLTAAALNNKTDSKDAIKLMQVSRTSQQEYAIFAAPVQQPNPTAVPEPSTWLLMIAGFALAGAGLRRRKERSEYRVRFA